MQPNQKFTCTITQVKTYLVQTAKANMFLLWLLWRRRWKKIAAEKGSSKIAGFWTELWCDNKNVLCDDEKQVVVLDDWARAKQLWNKFSETLVETAFDVLPKK